MSLMTVMSRNIIAIAILSPLTGIRTLCGAGESSMRQGAQHATCLGCAWGWVYGLSRCREVDGQGGWFG